MTPIAWVVEHSLQASERFRHLTVLPKVEVCKTCRNYGVVNDGYGDIPCWNCDSGMDM